MLTICTKSSGTQKENQNKMDYTKSYNWEAESDEKLQQKKTSNIRVIRSFKVDIRKVSKKE